MAKVVKDELIRHGVSTLEKRAIFAAAKRRGLTISEFVRQLRVKAVR